MLTVTVSSGEPLKVQELGVAQSVLSALGGEGA